MSDNQGQQIAVTAVKHDSQGTIHWTDADGQNYVSANSNPNTCLLFYPGYQTAGTLLHSTGDYYLDRTSCSQRGSCAGGCRCNDCPQQFGTNEDIDTAGPKMDLFNKVVAGATHYAKKGAEHAAAAIEKAKEKGNQLYAAAEHAAKEFGKKNAELQSANGNQDAETARMQLRHKQLQKVIKDEEAAIQDLDKIDKTKLTDAQQQTLEQIKQLFKDAAALLAPLVD